MMNLLCVKGLYVHLCLCEVCVSVTLGRYIHTFICMYVCVCVNLFKKSFKSVYTCAFACVRLPSVCPQLYVSQLHITTLNSLLISLCSSVLHC